MPRRMWRVLGGDADEHFRRGNYFEAAGVVLADPCLVVAEAVEVLQQLKIPFKGKGGVLVKGVERGEEDTAAQVAIGHCCHHWIELEARYKGSRCGQCHTVATCACGWRVSDSRQ